MKITIAYPAPQPDVDCDDGAKGSIDAAKPVMGKELKGRSCEAVY